MEPIKSSVALNSAVSTFDEKGSLVIISSKGAQIPGLRSPWRLDFVW